MRHPWLPHWVKDEKPAWVRQHLGAAGLPATVRDPDSLGEPTRGVDLWQARNFVGHNSDTHDFLYEEYSDESPAYRDGTLPEYEVIVSAYTDPAASDRRRATKLLRDAVPDLMVHPGIPPVGRDVPNDRALDDRQLVATGCGYCNEQARLFVRLCQVAGIPARIVFLFYLDEGQQTTTSGHVVAEFATADGWALADPSYQILFRDSDGSLLSAAEAHRSENATAVRDAYRRRADELRAMSDDELVGRRFEHLPPGDARAEAIREHARRKRPGPDEDDWGKQELGVFGIQNYPLPPADWTPD